MNTDGPGLAAWDLANARCAALRPGQESFARDWPVAVLHSDVEAMQWLLSLDGKAANP